jgi:hypothetical protein
MERSFDPGSVVIAKVADLFDYVRDLLPRHFEFAEHDVIDGEPRFWVPA